jgi:hypothetical protein
MQIDISDKDISGGHNLESKLKESEKIVKESVVSESDLKKGN